MSLCAQQPFIVDCSPLASLSKDQKDEQSHCNETSHSSDNRGYDRFGI